MQQLEHRSMHIHIQGSFGVDTNVDPNTLWRAFECFSEVDDRYEYPFPREIYVVYVLPQRIASAALASAYEVHGDLKSTSSSLLREVIWFLNTP